MATKATAVRLIAGDPMPSCLFRQEKEVVEVLNDGGPFVHGLSANDNAAVIPDVCR
jgi:hypothetical protein